ncbi:hypothetical protein E2P63_03985 [Candidatus Bathyarchaeota archaeon]|nr:hypothetical protein E2P63_03985 [Candidatus Bathyarchaeota archaeon]
MRTLEDWKIKIAVLWIVLECGMFAVPLVEQHIPGYMDEVIPQTTPEAMILIAIIAMVVPTMAFLSLTLKDSINRWLNILVSIFFIVTMPISIIDFPTDYLPSIIIIAIVEVVALVLIIWYAWKSKQKTQK